MISVNTLIAGVGRFPELIYISQKDDGEEKESSDPVKWETLIPYAGPRAEQDLGIFRPGEELSDYKAVVEAIGAGRRAAASIQAFLTGVPVQAPENMVRKSTRVLDIHQIEPIPQMIRESMPESSIEKRIIDPALEITTGYSEEQAIREANRCLQCGLICYRRVEGNLNG